MTTTRRFWQIHLSTAVAVVVVTGVMMFLNSYGVRNVEDRDEYGWPFKVKSKYDWVPVAAGERRVQRTGVDWSDPMLWVNYGCWVAISGVVVLLFERDARRRSKP
jgi:hypothetical protein